MSKMIIQKFNQTGPLTMDLFDKVSSRFCLPKLNDQHTAFEFKKDADGNHLFGQFKPGTDEKYGVIRKFSAKGNFMTE